MTLARAAEWCGGELRGPAGAESAVMTGATIDTRELRPGDLFVALPGERADGAEFIPEAARLGACAALCGTAGADPGFCGRLSAHCGGGPGAGAGGVGAQVARKKRGSESRRRYRHKRQDDHPRDGGGDFARPFRRRRRADSNAEF